MDEVNNQGIASPHADAFSDADLDSILADNGVSMLSSDDGSNASSEDEDDETSYDENQGEGGDDFDDPELDALVNGGSDDVSPASDAGPSNAHVNAIPPNSPSLLVDESTIRFSGAEWFSEIQKAHIILAGVGGIGSNVAFQLARMIPANITLYDDDNVEIFNMAGQLYKRSDIGKAKVDAIADMIYKYTAMKQVYAIKDKFTEHTASGDIMVCGFDNMKARKTFFKSWLLHVASVDDGERHKCLFLDGRLSMDTLQILCITGNDNHNIERYQREFLFDDSEAEATVCSMKQTTYLACMIGSLMVNLFTNFIANTLNPVIPYDLPFFLEYDAQNMLFNTEI